MRPKTITLWIEQLDARLRRLELARRTTVGPYVLEIRVPDGALVARHAVTGTVTVVALP